MKTILIKWILKICILVCIAPVAFSQIVGPTLNITDPYRGTQQGTAIIPASSVITSVQDFSGYNFNALFTFTYAVPNDFLVPATGDYEMLIIFNNLPYLAFLSENNILQGLVHDNRTTVSIFNNNTVRVRLNNNAFFQEYESFNIQFRVHIIQPGTGITAIQYSVNSNLGGSNANQFTSSFNIGSTPLPITMGLFTATKMDGLKGLLEWNTLKEENVQGFVIENSTNAKTWNYLGYIPSKAVDASNMFELQYNFWDIKPHEGNNYYRLKIVDLDQSFTYSEVRMLNFESKDRTIQIYPNPANDFIIIKSHSSGQLTIYDISGKTRITAPIIDNESNLISIKELESGTYRVVILDDATLLFSSTITIVH